MTAKKIAFLAVLFLAAGCAGCKKPDAPYVWEAPVYGEIETPCIVQTVYKTEDPVIADVVATNSPYQADPSGTEDSTAAIRAALEACAASGGGTVWLPAGQYRVTEPLTIPPYVTLRGDWQDPDEGNRYGTIILAETPPSDALTPGLFSIGGSAGVMGLTVYYPAQTLDEVKPYPFTFYVHGGAAGAENYMLQSIINCTVINGYRGIGACVNEGEVHEMLTVENVKGTFLSAGAHAMDQADVGTWKHITVSPKYWAEAGSPLTPANGDALRAYMREHTTGLLLADLEWTEFYGVNIEDCRVGVHLIPGRRISFAGSLYNVDIRRCGTGILADDMDNRWGMLVAGGVVEGEAYAVQNNTYATIRLSHVELIGETEGKRILPESDPPPLPVVREAKPVSKADNLIVAELDGTGSADVSAALQQYLDSAGEHGGLVYLRAGTYRLDSPVVVPPHVELRGASSVAQRENAGGSGGGTVFWVCAPPSASPEDDAALVTLQTGAGIRGVRFFYPENGDLHAVKSYAYTIRGAGADVYVENVSITAGYNGVDFRGCDRHWIKKLVGCVYGNMIHAGGRDGVIEGCLQNGNAIYRNGFALDGWPYDEARIWADLFDPILRMQAEYIRVTDAQNQSILNTFAYGVKTLITAVNSENVSVVNVGADNIGSTTPLLYVDGGSVHGANIMRYNGHSYHIENGRLTLQNRLSIGVRNERVVREEK